jgi:hypothetical protein
MAGAGLPYLAFSGMMCYIHHEYSGRRGEMAQSTGKKQKQTNKDKSSKPRCGTLSQMTERKGPCRQTEDVRQPQPFDGMDRVIRRNSR